MVLKLQGKQCVTAVVAGILRETTVSDVEDTV
jgi:hypothetical protein